MSVCTFFGHGECYGLDAAVLRNAVEDLIKQGTTEFLVGNHGQFDGMVFSCLQDLSKKYPEISYAVALAYLPIHKQAYDIYHGHICPYGKESWIAGYQPWHRGTVIATIDVTPKPLRPCRKPLTSA